MTMGGVRLSVSLCILLLAGCQPGAVGSSDGGLVIIPGAAAVLTSQTTTFRAELPAAAASTPILTWSVLEGAVGGSITAAGLYTAPATPGTYTVQAAAALPSAPDSKVTANAVVTVTNPPAGAPVRYLGVNLTWAAPYVNGAFMWADALKSGRPWSVGGTPAPVDANGWPTVAASLGFYEGNAWPSYYATSGYKLRFHGPADCAVTGLNVTITNLTAPDAQGYRTADVRVNSVSNTGLNFSTPVQDVSLMRPGTTYGTDYLAKEFLTAIAPFSVLRTMQTFGPGIALWGAAGNGVMWNRDTTWASRTKPNVGYAYNGPALEEFVIMANLSGKDIWINIPHKVDDDYITKVAQLLLYGSDGTTKLPYTSYQHDPATWTPGTTAWYPGLAPGRNVYVEFSNEIWNYLVSDATAAYNAELNGGDPHHYAATANGGYDKWIAWKTMKISQLFRQVWGDSAMQNRVRIVLANQGDWGTWWRHQNMLDYISAVFVNGGATYGAAVDGVPTGHPVNYYIHNLSGSFYIHWSSPSNLDTAFTQLNQSLSTTGGLPSAGESNSVKQRYGWAQAMAAKYGVKFTGYETGTEIGPASGGITDQADADPRMYTLFADSLHSFYSNANADVSVHFWLVGPTAIDAGLSPDLLSSGTQRWRAIRDLAAGN